MTFRFESKVTVWDMWKMSMHNIYHSMVGLCNIIFAVAIILLTGKFWDTMGSFLRSVLVLFCVLYPIIQPVMIYMRASQQVKSLPQDMIIEIDETGLHITADSQKAHMPWNRVRGVIKHYGMIIIAVDGGRGYILTDRVLGTQKDTLLEFFETKNKSFHN